MFKIAICGLDHWYTALGVLDIAKKAESVELVGVEDKDPMRREWLAEKHPDVAILEDATTSDADLVVICAPTGDAPNIAIRALEAGKHVLSVKPPAKTLAELDAVITTATRTGKFYGSFEGMQRLNPRAQILKKLITEGAIGTPLSFHQVGHGGLPSPWPGGESGAPSWWITPEKVPGGAWIDHAIYALDLARFVFGGEVDFAQGVMSNRLHTDLPLEDYGISLMRLTSGVALIFEDTWAAQPKAGHSRYFFLGTEGSITAEGSEWVVRRLGEETRHPIPDTPFFLVEVLAEALQSGDLLPFGPADARANLAACLNVYAAA
ncbi:MAG: Gfo/Idh/MocA family oxidoreductase [Armatimonas sp.]